MTDELKELYYLGFYTKVVNEAASAKKGDEEVEFVVLRSRLALNQIDFVLNSTKPLANPVQKGVNLLARAIKAGSPDKVDALLGEVDQALVRTSPLYAVCIGIINLRIDRISEALEVLNCVEHSEAAAVRIQALLAINRADLAEAEVANISEPIQAKVCKAFVGVCKDKESAHESLLEFQDLAESFARYGESPLLANAIAVCHFVLGEWESGCSAIEAAAEKFPSDESTAINRAVALAHTTEYEKLKEQIAVIQSFERNRYKTKLDEMLREFDERAAMLQNE